MDNLTVQLHPIYLENFLFSEFQFKVGSDLTSPYYFPAFTIKTSKTVNYEEKQISVLLKVSSINTKSKRLAVSFKFSVVGIFRCMDFFDAETAIQGFSASSSPYNLLWPYIRPFLAQSLQHLGLPVYHLPLIIKWEEDNGEFSTIQNIEK